MRYIHQINPEWSSYVLLKYQDLKFISELFFYIVYILKSPLHTCKLIYFKVRMGLLWSLILNFYIRPDPSSEAKLYNFLLYFYVVFFKHYLKKVRCGFHWEQCLTLWFNCRATSGTNSCCSFISIIWRMGKILWDRFSKAFQCLHFTCQTIFCSCKHLFRSAYRLISKMGLKEFHILIGMYNK